MTDEMFDMGAVAEAVHVVFESFEVSPTVWVATDRDVKQAP